MKRALPRLALGLALALSAGATWLRSRPVRAGAVAAPASAVEIGAQARLGPSAAPAVSQLVTVLCGAGSHRKPPRAAAWALGEIGPRARAAIPALIEAASSSDELLQMHVALALGKIAAADPRVVEALAGLADSPSPLVRACARASGP